MTAGRRIGVGVIGAGWMGMLHARSYLAVAPHYPELGVAPDLVVVADPVAGHAERVAVACGGAAIATDHRAVLDDPSVDVVSICGPNFVHRELALAAAAAGKPFWIEKPMGTGIEDARAIAAAAAAAGLVTCVGFNYRQAPAIAHARELVRSGSIGRVTTVRVRFDADYSAAPDGPRTWRFERARAGSGVLGDLLSHGFDLAHYVVGAIVEVRALTATFIPERPPVTGDGVGHGARGDAAAAPQPVENEDWAGVLARFAGGAVGILEANRTATGARCEYSIAVQGTEGSVRWDFERMNELEVCRPGGPYGRTRILTDPAHGDFARFQPGAGLGLSFDDLKTIEAARFLASVTTGEQLSPSVADGLAAAEVAHAAERSALDGRPHAVGSAGG